MDPYIALLNGFIISDLMGLDMAEVKPLTLEPRVSLESCVQFKSMAVAIAIGPLEIKDDPVFKNPARAACVALMLLILFPVSHFSI